MKISDINVKNYKRFTDLTIKDLPSTTKLVVLLGPNGCGKSSLFDAFKTWHLLRGYGNGSNEDYCKKVLSEPGYSHESVSIDFHEDVSSRTQEQFRPAFYFRTAYRNSPEITVRRLERVASPLEKIDNKMMIQNDATIDENYQRLMSETISMLYDNANDTKTVAELRDELLNDVREPLNRLFPDLLLTKIGLVTDKAEFYFSKGCVPNYGYEKLSGGEKAAFDLLLDFVVKSEFYKDTIFCIDEPETHIHTSLQGNLLKEIYSLVPAQSQLWIATHSFGMLKEAKRLKEAHPDEVVFLNFDGYDFDEHVIIEPSECDTVLWNKMLEITLDDYSQFIIPESIIFCEGTTKGHKRKDFDARCYTTIFGSKHPSTMFYSLGSCSEIEEKEAVTRFISSIAPSSKIIKVIDRDDRSEEEIQDLISQGINVLSKRHLECYILDDEILTKWCNSTGHSDLVSQMLKIKSQKIADSISRGNAPDDIKSASNEICTEGKRLLGLTSCGNTGEMIMRDTLSKLITSETAIYKQLEKEIFG